MDAFLSGSLKFFLVAATAPFWWPLVKEVVAQVRAAADDPHVDAAPLPQSVHPNHERVPFEDGGSSAWSKHRRTNRHWDTGR